MRPQRLGSRECSRLAGSKGEEDDERGDQAASLTAEVRTTSMRLEAVQRGLRRRRGTVLLGRPLNPKR